MKLPAEREHAQLPVELLVNGRKVSARSGQTILELVRGQDLDDIPTLCDDPRLEPYGSCFLCVVEVKGTQRLLPACVTRIRDGMEVTTRSERIHHARKTALELLLSDHYADCFCPARLACPAGVDIQGYLSLARLGRYREALALVKERNPLPVVCSRVCVRKCEARCLRNQVDEPVGINFVKRYISENASPPPEAARKLPPTGKRAAIVGGGPAGLTCAYYLALKGHAVTIFEALPKLGGMLRYGIPKYRLPRAELDEEIGGIIDLGVTAVTGQSLGLDFTVGSLLQKDRFDAVFLALGAPLGKKMAVRGEDHVSGLESAIDFLRQVELDRPPMLHGRVAVVGGGNSAIDAARTAVRCGADEVTILYRRTRKEMPAHPEEVDAAEKEGVRLELLVAPLEILADDGHLKAIRCQRMELGEPDASGRRKPVPIQDSTMDFACEHLFSAIGQDTDLSVFQADAVNRRPSANRWSTLETDPATLATSVKGVFAGGDIVNGPSAVIDAIAQGRGAAEAMDSYMLAGEVRGPGPGFMSRRDAFGPLPDWTFEDVERIRRSIQPERDVRERIRDFAQVELGLAEPEMKFEANRCMECGCKSAFECDLKRYSTEYGVDIARFAGKVRRQRVDRSHPLITLDPNKCILCGRCIRTCAEIVGLAVFGFVGRGFETVVKPAVGKPLAESTCIACGACVETCPTGAIEAQLPYGRQGPWQTRRVPSVCNFCSVGCRIDLNVAADGLLWATAPQSPGSSQGELCFKGRFGTGLIHSSDRLRTPLVRKAGKLTEAGWDEAIATAAQVLARQREKHGAESIAVAAAPRMTLEEAVLVRHLANEALGTCEVGSIGEHYRSGPRHDLDRILGDTASTCVQDDIDRADTILLAGCDPGSTHPVLAMAIRRAAAWGARIVAVNSSRIDLLHAEDLWLDARRGTAGILYAAILRDILFDGLAADFTDQEDELAAIRSSVARASLDEAAEIAGVDAGKITACEKTLCGDGRVVAVYDLDDTLERADDDLPALAQVLITTGHLRNKGGGLLLLRSDCNSAGARLAGIANPLHMNHIRTALVIFENPFADNRVAGELGQIESMVVIDHFLTETGRLAEVVLPAATLAESDGTVVSFDGGLGMVRQASRPVAGLTTGEVLARLCSALRRSVPSTDPGQIRADLASSLRIPAAEFENARNLGLPLPRQTPSAIAFQALRLNPAASVANFFPYATLDGVLGRKLESLGVVK